MFEKHMQEAAEKLAANLNPMPHLLAAMGVLGARLDALGHEATGETGVEVEDLGDRLTSLTSAVSSIGQRVDSIGEDFKSQLGAFFAGVDARIKALEDANKTQAAPPVPPVTQ